MDADHFQAKHPGAMDSRDALCEEDKNGENVYGTSEKANYLDRYIESKHTNMSRAYFIYGKDLGEFLVARYGGQIIVRYYIKKNMSYYSEVEVHLNQVRTQFLNAQLINTGTFTDDMFKKWWTQVSHNSTLKDVKMRLLDHVRSAGLNITEKDVRLWLHTDDTINPKKTDLKIACTAAAKSAAEQKSSPSPAKEGLEVNSGFDFCGESMEPLLKKGLRVH